MTLEALTLTIGVWGPTVFVAGVVALWWSVCPARPDDSGTPARTDVRRDVRACPDTGESAAVYATLTCADVRPDAPADTCPDVSGPGQAGGC